jgi:hypothetical protein
MFKVLIPAAATLALIAAAAQSQSGTRAETDLHDPLPMAWYLSQEGDMARLAYGLANSDQLLIMLTCAPGDARVRSYGTVTPAGADLPEGPAPMDPLLGLAMAGVTMDVNAPALRTLREEGRLPVLAQTGRSTLSAAEPDKAVIAGFFAHCAKTAA